jgi:adenylate cyclase
MPIASDPVPEPAADPVGIGEWQLAARGNELRRGSEVVRLEPKAAEVLAFLAARRGEVVAREELLLAVWPGVVVGDDALTQAIIKLRKALGDDAHAPRYIETIAKRGYRLIAPVGGNGPGATQSIPPRPRRRWLAALAGTVVAAGLAGWLALPRMPWPVGSQTPARSATGAPPLVALLPLANLGGDAQRDYLADGLTEDIINGLGRFSGVRVMSRNAVQEFKGKAASPQHVGAALGARYVVQGTVRESQGRTRITLQVAETSTGALLASQQYDAEGVQLLEIQERIVRQVVGALHVKLSEIEERRAFAKPTGSLEAYDLVLNARALLNRTTRESNRQARELASRALVLAPDYAGAMLVLGGAELQRVIRGWVEDAETGLRRAHDHASQVLSLPDLGTHSGAYLILSAVATLRDRNDEALENAARALELNPSDTRALARRGSALTWLGRLDEAILLLEMSRRLDPNAPEASMTPLVIAYYSSARYAEAVLEAERIAARYPHVSSVHAMHSAALAQVGRLEEAREAAARVRNLDPIFQVEQWGTRFSISEHRERLQDGLRKAGL